MATDTVIAATNANRQALPVLLQSPNGNQYAARRPALATKVIIMTTSPDLRDCENEASLIRRNIFDIHNQQEELRRRIQGLHRAIAEIEDRKLVPGFRLRIGELQALIGATQAELTATMPELENFRQQLHIKEQKCWELRRQRTQPVPSEDELRKTINDPRYWRDGDPELSRIVSEGFQRLYPGDSDD